MLGLSDTTVGTLVSVILHAGVAAAFLGPLGEGTGAGSTVVMVSIDGIEVPESKGEDLQRGEPLPVLPSVPQEPQGALRSRQEPPHPATARAMPLKRHRAPAPPPVAQLPDPIRGESGGGGLLGTLYSQPVMTFMPKPLYPRSARAQGVEGKVSVKVWVTDDGSVERAEVVKGSGSDLLDREAHESALEARFKPALKAGVPTAAEKIMVVTFDLFE